MNAVCLNCSWWDRDGQKEPPQTPSNKHLLSLYHACLCPELDRNDWFTTAELLACVPLDGAGQMYQTDDDYPSIVTGPEFGCVHFSAVGGS